MVLRKWLSACIDTGAGRKRSRQKAGEKNRMTSVVMTETTPIQESWYDSGEQTMTPTAKSDNGSARKKSKVPITRRERIVLDQLRLVQAIAARVDDELPVHGDSD